MFSRFPLISVSVRNGALAGVLGFILLVTLFKLGRHPFLIPVFFDFRIMLFASMLFFTLKEFRDYYHSGVLFLWEGMILSLLFTIVFSIVAGFLVWVFASWSEAFVQGYISGALDQLRALPDDVVQQVGKDVFNRELVLVPKTTPFDLAVRYFWQSFVISFFLSIIIAVILRRQPKP
jgi:hypothetical protein